jgi:16S rRNA (uracil1498-N3)-methyltransferase
MRLHHFFVERVIGAATELSFTEEGLIHQLKQVFRYRAGDQLVLLDNTGYEYVAEIRLLTKEQVEVVILEKRLNLVRPSKKVHLYMSLIKKDKFEWVLEKATELGVTDITPVVSERTEKKDFNEVRARKIIVEATEQSGRGIMPVFHDTVELADAVAGANGVKVALHFSDQPLMKAEFAGDEEISLFVGPEGGWGESDLAVFSGGAVEMRGMGPATLRAETAAVAGLAVILI